MLRLSKSKITCHIANIRVVGPNPTVFLVLETCVTSETVADFWVNQPCKHLSLPRCWSCSAGEMWSFPGASRCYTSLHLKWGEDSWALRGSSDIVLAKPAACARPNCRMCTKQDVTRGCVALPEQSRLWQTPTDEARSLLYCQKWSLKGSQQGAIGLRFRTWICVFSHNQTSQNRLMQASCIEVNR